MHAPAAPRSHPSPFLWCTIAAAAFALAGPTGAVQSVDMSSMGGVSLLGRDISAGLLGNPAILASRTDSWGIEIAGFIWPSKTLYSSDETHTAYIPKLQRMTVTSTGRAEGVQVCLVERLPPGIIAAIGCLVSTERARTDTLRRMEYEPPFAPQEWSGKGQTSPRRSLSSAGAIAYPLGRLALGANVQFDLSESRAGGFVYAGSLYWSGAVGGCYRIGPVVAGLAAGGGSSDYTPDVMHGFRYGRYYQVMPALALLYDPWGLTLGVDARVNWALDFTDWYSVGGEWRIARGVAVRAGCSRSWDDGTWVTIANAGLSFAWRSASLAYSHGRSERAWSRDHGPYSSGSDTCGFREEEDGRWRMHGVAVSFGR